MQRGPTMDEIIGYGFLWLLLGLFLFLLFLAIYKGIKPDNKVQRRIDAFFERKSVKALVQTISVGFWLIVGLSFGGSLVVYYFTESAWFPRTREVPVYANVFTWVTGELKTCYSELTPSKDELAYLVCDAEAKDYHLLKVRFWGTITTEREKSWKCEREEASLTCKLQ